MSSRDRAREQKLLDRMEQLWLDPDWDPVGGYTLPSAGARKREDERGEEDSTAR